MVIEAPALVLLGMIGPRWSPVAYLFALLPVRPAELEPSAPVRFAQSIALSMMAAAIGLLYGGLETAGWIVVGVVAAVALFSAITGICIGCIAWKQVIRRVGAAHDLKNTCNIFFCFRFLNELQLSQNSKYKTTLPFWEKQLKRVDILFPYVFA